MAQSTKLTRNQQIVRDCLKAAGQPLSAYDILNLDAAREQGLKAPLTIYRALDKLLDTLISKGAISPSGPSVSTKNLPSLR